MDGGRRSRAADDVIDTAVGGAHPHFSTAVDVKCVDGIV